MAVLENGVLARLETLHDQMDRLEKWMEKLDGRMLQHDGSHVILAKGQYDQAALFGERLTRVETDLKAKTFIMAGWQALMTAALAALGIGRQGA